MFLNTSASYEKLDLRETVAQNPRVFILRSEIILYFSLLLISKISIILTCILLAHANRNANLLVKGMHSSRVVPMGGNFDN